MYTLFSFINNGIAFVLLLALAGYLTPGAYGELNLFNTLVTLLGIVISLGTTSYIAVSFFKRDAATLRGIINVSFGVSAAMLVLMVSVVSLFPSFLERLTGLDQEYLLAGIAICFFQVFNAVNLDIWRLEEKPLSYGLYGVSFAICNFALTFWLVVGAHLGWQGRIYAWFLLGALYFVISLVFLVKRGYLVLSVPSKAIWIETLLYALPLVPHTASFWMKQGLDRYIINYFYDPSAVGYYSFAMNMAAIITMIGTAFNATNSVFIYKKLAEGYAKVKDSMARQTRLMSLFFSAAGLVIMLAAWLMIQFFLPKYMPGIKYLLPLCAGAVLQCIYLLWVNYLFYYKRTVQLMHITLSTALLQVALSLWLTRYTPLYTAYISMTVTALSMILVRRQAKNVLKAALQQG